MTIFLSHEYRFNGYREHENRKNETLQAEGAEAATTATATAWP